MLYDYGVYGMLPTVLGIVAVTLVVLHWMLLLCYIDRESTKLKNDATMRAWTQPNARNPAGSLFVDRIKLGEFKICGDKLKCVGRNHSSGRKDDGWSHELKYPLDSETITKPSKLTKLEWLLKKDYGHASQIASKPMLVFFRLLQTFWSTMPASQI
eukprot:COSAG05_NODE_373_length_10684_cov_22.075012_11_plen_156_part_00